MISKWSVIVIVWLHFLADFFMQSNDMATKKSSSNIWLGIHVSVYSLPFLLLGVKYALFNAACHFVVDYFTSRFNKKMWEAKEVHWFFNGVGFDQSVHYTILVLTFGVF